MTEHDLGLEEPTSAMREVARTLRDMYVALRKEHFSEQEALDIIAATIRAMTFGGQQ